MKLYQTVTDVIGRVARNIYARKSPEQLAKENYARCTGLVLDSLYFLQKAQTNLYQEEGKKVGHDLACGIADLLINTPRISVAVVQKDKDGNLDQYKIRLWRVCAQKQKYEDSPGVRPYAEVRVDQDGGYFKLTPRTLHVLLLKHTIKQNPRINFTSIGRLRILNTLPYQEAQQLWEEYDTDKLTAVEKVKEKAKKEILNFVEKHPHYERPQEPALPLNIIEETNAGLIGIPRRVPTSATAITVDLGTIVTEDFHRAQEIGDRILERNRKRKPQRELAPV